MTSPRQARCIYYGKAAKYPVEPDGLCHSSTDSVTASTKRAFFEDTGPGSDWATETCSCGYADSAHGETNRFGRPGITDHTFSERGPGEFDFFYCGCWGWD